MSFKNMYTTPMPPTEGQKWLSEIPKHERPVIDMEYVKVLTRRYNEILAKKGCFVDNVLECLDTIATNTDTDEPLYTLVPLNMVLWLYRLGSKVKDQDKLFNGLITSINRIQKFKGHKDVIMPISHMPISSAAKTLIRKNYSKGLAEAKKNTFMHLQAIITALVCSACGREYPVDKIIYNTLNRSVPGLTDHLGGVPIIERIDRKEYRRIYLNSYSEGSPHWRTMLYQASQANNAVLLMKYLFLRAKDVLQSNTGTGTSRITREEFVRKLCMLLQLSAYKELRRTMGYVILSGVWRFW